MNIGTLRTLIGVIAGTCLVGPLYADSLSQSVEYACSRENDTFLLQAEETYGDSRRSTEKEYSPSKVATEKLKVSHATLNANESFERSCKLKNTEIVAKVIYGQPTLSGPDSGTPGAILNLSVNGVETLKEMTFDRPCQACSSVSRVAYINGKLEICGTYHDETRCTFLEKGDLPVPVRDLFLFQNMFWK